MAVFRAALGLVAAGASAPLCSSAAGPTSVALTRAAAGFRATRELAAAAGAGLVARVLAAEESAGAAAGSRVAAGSGAAAVVGATFLAALGEGAKPAAGAAFTVALGVRLVLGAVPTGPAGSAAGSATLARPLSEVPAFVARVVRRPGAAPVVSSFTSADEASVDVAPAPGSVCETGETATSRAGRRVDRARGAASAVDASDVAGSDPTGWARDPASSGPRPRVPAIGFCATCARSRASSSGGTSLHGSLELRGGGATSRSGRL